MLIFRQISSSALPGAGRCSRTSALTGPRQVKFPFQSRPIRGSVSNALFVAEFVHDVDLDALGTNCCESKVTEAPRDQTM